MHISTSYTSSPLDLLRKADCLAESGLDTFDQRVVSLRLVGSTMLTQCALSLATPVEFDVMEEFSVVIVAHVRKLEFLSHQLVSGFEAGMVAFDRLADAHPDGRSSFLAERGFT